MTPGRHLQAWARRVCSEDTMACLVEPVIADMQHESAEAYGAGRARRFWILATSYAAFWRVVLFHVPLAEGGRAWASAGARDRRALGIAALVFVGVTLLLVAPPAQHLYGRNAREQAWLFVLLLPQPVALSMPTTLFIAVVYALRRRAVSSRVCRTISVLAVATALAMFFIINGLVPASNQAFRETLAARLELEGRQYVLERGPTELSLLEMRRQAQSLERESRPRQAGRLLLALHQRISLAAAPLALTLLALALAGARARVAAMAGAAACGVFVAWMFAASNMDRAMLGREWVAIALAWFPNALLVATAMAVGVFSGGASSEPRDA